ncbi:MAG: 2-C-methyl-D-erythritol 4-phosphate cytidylyltransferase [Elusimicrobiota bacterium]
MNEDKIALIIPAGGIGVRLKERLNGESKQFTKIGNKTILEYTLDKFYSFVKIKECIIVIPAEIPSEVSLSLTKKYPGIKVVCGGATRQDSVKNGLDNLSLSDGIVIIHDAVRPFFSKEQIDNTISAAKTWGAAVLGVKAKDTIRLADDNNFSKKTLNRKKIWLIQTPQIFKIDLIRRAYKHAYANNIVGTDDAYLVEELGERVALVEGEYSNIKITDPFDMIIAEAIVRRGDCPI